MRESTVIQGWIDLGIEKGKLEKLRENIRTIIRTRFGAVSPELLRRIEEASNRGQLDGAFEQALSLENPEDLRL